MAKAQAVKPKSSFFGDFFKRFSAPKAKPSARPASGQASTMTNIPAVTATGRQRVVKATDKPTSRMSLSRTTASAAVGTPVNPRRADNSPSFKTPSPTKKASSV